MNNLYLIKHIVSSTVHPECIVTCGLCGGARKVMLQDVSTAMAGVRCRTDWPNWRKYLDEQGHFDDEQNSVGYRVPWVERLPRK
jgi:hypothetical protein